MAQMSPESLMLARLQCRQTLPFLRTLLLRMRYGEKHLGSFPQGTFYCDISFMSLYDFLDDAHPQAQALHRFVLGVRAVKFVENLSQLILAHADAMIDDGNFQFVWLCCCHKFNHPAFRRILY